MKLTGLFLVAAMLLLAVAPSSPLLHNLKTKLAKLLKKGPEEVCHTVYEDRTAPHCETTYEQVSRLQSAVSARLFALQIML